MVVPIRQPRSSSTFSKHILQVAIAVFLLVASYIASISETPSDDNHHWKPPFLDWLLSQSQDDDPGTTIKRDIVVPESSRYQTNKNHINASSGGLAAPHVVNVPTLRSKLKLKDRGATQYLGIMVDAGRHYFPVLWLEALLHYMAGLGYNWLHLRLTDDQAFSVKFESHPKLARSAPSYDQVYSVHDLKGLVKLAKELGIIIVPEINVPGHAASWHRIPGLIVPCPRFICTYGYAIPLNLESPKLLPVIRDLLMELKDIFGSEFVHLGGDELEQAEGCFHELGQVLPDYAAFEASLQTIVQEVGFEHVLRWERSNRTTTTRVGDITQYWMKDVEDYPNDLPSNFFTSAGLYMDVNEDANAYDVYEKVRKNQDLNPKGIVVGTFELGTDWWKDRNVFGRMIAASMAFLGDSMYDDQTSFAQAYGAQCMRLLGKESYICGLNGKPMLPYRVWRGEEWDKTFYDWKVEVCIRVTEPFVERTMLALHPHSDRFNSRQAEEIALARSIFVERLRKRRNKPMPEILFRKNKYGKLVASDETYQYPPRHNRQALFRHRVGHTGVTVDLARHTFPVERLNDLVEHMSLLGFNTLHLRLVDDFSFAVAMKSHPDIAWATKQGGAVYTYSGLRELVEFAHSRSVEIIPEINMMARSGGWFAAGFVAPCPNHICKQGFGIPLNLTNVPLMAVVSNIVEELRLVFNSPFFHFGYDERDESAPCLREAQIKVDFDAVEKKLAALLAVLDIPLKLVMRWQTSEDKNDDVRLRAGAITHYQWTNPPKNASDPFFVSTDLQFNRQDDDGYQIYLKARAYGEYEMILGVLAGTMEISPKAWSGRNIEGKLIAMAIGLSTLPYLEEAEFEKVYEKTCSELNIQGDVVKLLGKSRWTTVRWEDQLKDDRGRRGNTTCTRMTGLTQSRKMKVETLG